MDISDENKRKFDRLNKNFELKLQEVDLYEELEILDKEKAPVKVQAKIINLSAGGALIESEKAFEIKTLLKLMIDMPEWEKYKSSFFSSRIVFPSPPFGITAEIIREYKITTEGHKRFAVKFVGLDYSREKALDKLVTAYNSKK